MRAISKKGFLGLVAPPAAILAQAQIKVVMRWCDIKGVKLYPGVGRKVVISVTRPPL